MCGWAMMSGLKIANVSCNDFLIPAIVIELMVIVPMSKLKQKKYGKNYHKIIEIRLFTNYLLNVLSSFPILVLSSMIFYLYLE